jgi:hypothetical protein
MLLAHLIMDECPCCHKGKVFQNTNLLSFKPGKMNTECPVCHENFNREPGFYWGSMYVSYALAVAEAFITYFICIAFGRESFDMVNLWIILTVIIVLSPFNFRMARLTWLYIFARIG